MNRPDAYSPLLKLAGVLVLWSLVPAAIVAAGYYMDVSTRTSSQTDRIRLEQSNRRAMEDYQRQSDAAYGTASDIVSKAQGKQ